MLIQGHKRFQSEPFSGVQELRDFVADHREMLLGKPTVLLEASELKELGSFERLPDFLALDVVGRHWAIVVIEPEALSAGHGDLRWLAKMERLARQAGTRKGLGDLIISQVKSKPGVLRSFEAAGVHAIDIREVLGDVFAQEPMFDLVAEKPREGPMDLTGVPAPSFRVWPVRKFVQEGVPENVIYSVPEGPQLAGTSGIKSFEKPASPAALETRPPAGAPPGTRAPGAASAPVGEAAPPPIGQGGAGAVSERVRSLLVAGATTPARPPSGAEPAEAPKEPVAALSGMQRRIGFAPPPGGRAERGFLDEAEGDADVTLEELVSRGYLRAGDVLTKRYRWATGEVSEFEGTVGPDGSFQVREIADPGPTPRGRPEDGLWRTRDGVPLTELKQRCTQDPGAGPHRSNRRG